MKKFNLRSQKKASSLFGMLASGLVIVALVLNLLWPDRARSMVENRPLAGFPAPEMQTLAKGKWQNALNDWFSDQFVGRDSLFAIDYLIKKLSGVKIIDDVFLGHQMLIQQASPKDETILDRKAQAINHFFKMYPLHTMIGLVPGAQWVERSHLPSFVVPVDQPADITEFISRLDPSIQGLDISKNLEQVKDEYVFYKTDHHWTSLGAWQGASALLQACQIEPDLSAYDRYPVSNTFEGTLQARTGSIFLKDTIDIYVAKNNPDYLVMANNDGVYESTIYDQEALAGKDQYEVFLGGNDALVQISANTPDSNRHLLVFKDSYANAMIQFLLPYFRTITIVDPRYFYDNIDRLMEANMITDVLYLYSYNTFQTDTTLADVLESAGSNSVK